MELLEAGRMFGLLCFVLAVLASPFKSKLRLEADNVVLRQQLKCFEAEAAWLCPVWTSLSARLDPEDMQETLTAYQNAVAADPHVSTDTLPSSWVTACWPTSAGRTRTRMRLRGR